MQANGRQRGETRPELSGPGAVGLFRYQLVREAADPQLSTRARGQRWCASSPRASTRARAGGRCGCRGRHPTGGSGPGGRGGFDALVPSPRQPGTPRTPAEVMELAVALKRENPARTAAQVARILRAQLGWAPSERTLQRHFAGLELDRDAARPGAGGVRPVRSRPAATSCGPATPCTARWWPAGRPTCSRSSTTIPGGDGRHRFGFAEDTVRLAAALRPALASRGVPESIYVDNGSAFVDAWLLRACAKLGIKLIHSTPGRPQGRGKIERLFRTVRDQFLVEITGRRPRPAITGAGHELNRLFTAWVETVYHRRVALRDRRRRRCAAGRRQPGPVAAAHPGALAEAFLWAEYRTVTKTATVSLHGNTYQVDPVLAGRRSSWSSTRST